MTVQKSTTKSVPSTGRKTVAARSRRAASPGLSDNAFRLAVIVIATGAAVVHAYLSNDSTVLGSFVAGIGGAIFASLGRSK